MMNIPPESEVGLDDLNQISQAVSFGEYWRYFEGRADYLKSNNPGLVIRSGLIEETGEVLQADPGDLAEVSKEIGDIAFYLTASAQLVGLDLAGVFEQYDISSMQEIQGRRPPRLIPIFSPEGDVLDTKIGTIEKLIVDLLRVVDLMNPKTEQLWSHLVEKPSPERVISEAFFSLGEFAEEGRIELNEAVKLSLKKIYSRSRNPHVIDQDRDGKMLGSMRERITLHPAVNAMRIATIFNNVDVVAVTNDDFA